MIFFATRLPFVAIVVVAGFFLRLARVEGELALRRVLVLVCERFLARLAVFLPVVFFKDTPFRPYGLFLYPRRVHGAMRRHIEYQDGKETHKNRFADSESNGPCGVASKGSDL